MNFKILKDIVKVTFKKNWVMILSFFIFLLVSSSVLFGLTSFVVGFHGQIPTETWSSQKKTATFTTGSIYYDDTKSDDSAGIDMNSVNKFKDNDYIRNQFNNLLNLFNNEKLGPNDADKILSYLINWKGGDLKELLTYDKYQKYKFNDSDLTIDELTNAIESNMEPTILKATGSISFTSYIFANEFKNGHLNDGDNKAYFWNYSLVTSNPKGTVGSYYSQNVYLVPPDSSDFSSLTKYGHFKDKKYEKTKNVVYTTLATKRSSHLKIGQKIILSYNGDVESKQQFIYGGVYTPDIKKINNESDGKNENYYIMNYDNSVQKMNKDYDFRTSQKYQNQRYYIWYKNLPRGISLSDMIVNKLSQFLTINDKYAFIAHPGFSSYYDFYNAMLMLAVIIGVVLVLLDIVLSWFLIKQVINNTAKQILFLKAIGLNNRDASLINATSIGIILGIAWILSFVGMLIIEYVMVNMIQNFLDVYVKWNTIAPFSLIIIFGVAILLFVVYFISNWILIKKLNLATNSVVHKGEVAFSSLKDYIFARNVNSGITFAFATKNMGKIFVAWIIVLLVMTLTFIAAQFVTSINESVTQIQAFNSGYDNASNTTIPYYRTPGESYDASDKDNNKASGSIVAPTIRFIDGDESKGAYHLDFKNIPDNLTNYYVTRSDIYKLIKHVDEIKNPVLKDDIDKYKTTFISFDTGYENTIKQLYHTTYDYKINFGMVYSNGAKGETAYQIHGQYAGQDSFAKLVVLPKDDARNNILFKNVKDTFNNDNKTLPIATSFRYLQVHDVSLGYVSDDSTIVSLNTEKAEDLHSKIKLKIAAANTNLVDTSTVYVRQDDFDNYLSYALNTNGLDSFQKSVIENIKDLGLNKQGTTNSFISKSIPTFLQQFVIPNVSDVMKNNNKNQSTASETNHQQKSNIEDYLNQIKLLLTTSLAGKNKNPASLVSINFLKLMSDEFKRKTSPMQSALIVILILAIVMMLTFIIFMAMTIMQENDSSIFIMKALGYHKYTILWRIIAGYLLSIIFGFVCGVGISIGALHVLDAKFINIMYIHVLFYGSSGIIALIIISFIVLVAIVTSIAAIKINKRSLTIREE